MKFSKDKKKRKIEKRIWNMLREIAKLKSDRMCEVCGSRNDLQTDHCFSSTVAVLRFDHRNLSCLCSGCHTMKTFNTKGWEKRVDNAVRIREGSTVFKQMMDLAANKKPHKWEIEI